MGGSLKRVFQSACLEHDHWYVTRLTQNAWSHDAEPLVLKFPASKVVPELLPQSQLFI